MTIKSDLIAARKLIEEPARWVQHTMGKDGSFCAIGAVKEVTNGLEEYYRFQNVRDELRKYISVQRCAEGLHSCNQVSCFNDTHTHAEVLALFDKAIEACNE